MMHVTFLDHSGFLVELPGLTLLFDWWQGDLPPLPSDPLLVFASHRHPDHFNPRILLWMTVSGMSDSFLARASI